MPFCSRTPGDRMLSWLCLCPRAKLEALILPLRKRKDVQGPDLGFQRPRDVLFRSQVEKRIVKGREIILLGRSYRRLLRGSIRQSPRDMAWEFLAWGILIELIGWKRMGTMSNTVGSGPILKYKSITICICSPGSWQDQHLP